MDSNLHTRAQRIEWLFLDVDGVLTDGRLYFTNGGEELKAFNTQDGLGIKLLRQSGVRVGIITGRESQLVARRAEKLGVDLLIQGRDDKWQALCEWRQDQTPPLEAIAFMGDDWPDLAIMTRVGLALCPANAHPSVSERCHWQSALSGGEGAVRSGCDLILQARGDWEDQLARFIQG